MKKVIFTCLLGFTPFLFAETDLDQKIEQLKKEIHEIRIKETNKETSADRVLRSDSSRFVQEIEEAQILEMEAEQMQTELNELLDQKKPNKDNL